MPIFDRRALIVAGPDRKSWLNGLTTCDVAQLPPDAAIYGLAIQKNGRIVSDLYLFEAEPTLLAFVPSSVAEGLAKALDAYLIMEDATVAVGEFALFAVLGPGAYVIAQAARKASSRLIARSYDGWGVPAVLVAAPDARAGETESLLRQAVAAGGGQVGTAEEWGQLRAHGSIPEFGIDFDGSMYPQEAGLATRAVSFSKGCYLGQEVVCMLEMRGQVRRKLVVISYEGEPLPPNSKVLSTAGEPAGETKGAVVDGLQPGRSLAFAMLKRVLAEAGTELVVAAGDGASRVARVVERTWP